MCSGVNGRDFRSGARSGSYGTNVAIGDIKTMRAARTLLWEDLHKFNIKACKINTTQYINHFMNYTKLQSFTRSCNEH